MQRSSRYGVGSIHPRLRLPKDKLWRLERWELKEEFASAYGAG